MFYPFGMALSLRHDAGVREGPWVGTKPLPATPRRLPRVQGSPGRGPGDWRRRARVDRRAGEAAGSGPLVETVAEPAQLALVRLLHRSPVILPLPDTSSVAHYELTDEQFEALQGIA